MRREQARTSAALENRHVLRENVERVCVDYDWLWCCFEEMQDLTSVRATKAGTDSPDINLVVEKFVVGSNRFDHHLRAGGARDDGINVLGHEELHQARAGAECA